MTGGHERFGTMGEGASHEVSTSETAPEGIPRRPYDGPKRLLDVISSAVGLVVLSPVLLVVAVLVAVRLGRPVIFSQPRPGRGERIFTLRKFRSMRQVSDASVVADEERLSSFGRALRSTSLDELPSLWNVLVGDMSMVGPRPLLVEYLPLYTAEQSRRHQVRPGITGLAQVRGRNALSWQEKFRIDAEYVDKRSFALDARIVLSTVRAVLARQGISQVGHATMTRFGESDA